ncbi:type II toxin-antitoxin system RelE family toxin [Nocardia sp. JW2]|uniref:type II toxin-antitoxin system RelE family toxin n=1 Tax=Nocardia sp. JW2 TaxID=3450738 RepID=UPI003F43489B
MAESPDQFGTYTVQIERSAKRSLNRLEPAAQRDALRDAIKSLENNPRPDGCCKLTGPDSSYRIRVGQYRAVYVVDDKKKTVDVTDIGNRGDIYRRR